MASSSDWIARMAKGESEAPAWIGALNARGEFNAGFPLAKPHAEGSCPAARSATPDTAQSDLDVRLAQAYADGEAAGRTAAEAEQSAASKHHRALRLAFRTLDQTAMDTLASELADTVMQLCDQVLADCAIDRPKLMEMVQSAAQRIGTVPEQCSLRLHPDDIEVIGEEALQSWKVVAEPSVERGNIVLEDGNGAVSDGPEEWRRAIAEALRG